MQITPRSAKTIAPASNLLSPVSVSEVTAAVNPTPEEPLPVVVIARGAIDRTYLNSCDFATDGSPINNTFMSLHVNLNYFRKWNKNLSLLSNFLY